MPIPRFLCAPPPNHEKSRGGWGGGALIPAEVFTHWERPPAEAQGRRDGNWTTNRRRPRLHGSSTESPLCASAPLRENLLRSLCAPPIRASLRPVTARTEERKQGQVHNAIPPSRPVDSQRLQASQRFVKWTDLTPLPLTTGPIVPLSTRKFPFINSACPQHISFSKPAIGRLPNRQLDGQPTSKWTLL